MYHTFQLQENTKVHQDIRFEPYLDLIKIKFFLQTKCIHQNKLFWTPKGPEK